MTVYAYVDALSQPIKQVDVVKYFATRPEGPSVFTQSTVAQTTTLLRDGNTCVLKSQCIVKQMTTHCHKTRGGSSIVAVGSAHGAEARGVNTRILVAKRAAFEEAFGVPEDERLTGPGWVQSFCRA